MTDSRKKRERDAQTPLRPERSGQPVPPKSDIEDTYRHLEKTRDQPGREGVARVPPVKDSDEQPNRPSR